MSVTAGPEPDVTSRATSPATPARSAGKFVTRRLTVRLHPDLYERVQYWAARREMAANEYVIEALETAIRHENRDYDLPTAEVARLNQLIDEIKALSTTSANLERVITRGFDSLIGLTRGTNYLLDDEDGEL